VSDPTKNFMMRVTLEQAQALRLAAYRQGRPPSTVARLVITNWLEHEGYLDQVRREREDEPVAAE